MKRLHAALALSLTASTMAIVAAVGGGSSAVAAAEPTVDQMRKAAQGKVSISEESATGRVGFIRAQGKSGDLLPAVEGRSATTADGASAKANRYVQRFAEGFGALSGELKQTAVRANPTGYTVEFTQEHDGIPVFAAEIRAQVDKQGDLTSVNGYAAPVSGVDTTPDLSESEAAAKAIEKARKSQDEHSRGTTTDVSGLEVTKNVLSFYRMGSIRGVEGETKLAYVAEVTNERTVRDTVIIDADTGKSLARWSMMAHATDREVYEEALEPGNLVWSEGDAFPGTINQDQQNEVLGAGETYWLFMNTFGYDSYDGEGAKMITVNNDPTIQCPNANWNGVSTNYCDGVTGDDTVAHEWAHAYTEYTSGLIYAWQPGALNEAYSDIWGETVDLLNPRMNSATEGDPRDEDEDICSVDSSVPQVEAIITAPAAQAGICQSVAAADSPGFPETATPVTVVVGQDGTDFATDGCEPFTNAAEIDGNYVYVDENLGCSGSSPTLPTYDIVATNATNAGAAGLIVGSEPGFEPWNMPNDTFSLPAFQVAAEDGERFVTAGTAQATVRGFDPEGFEDESTRWLSGEDDPAFGGAIRDMWNPTCYGHPGKVSDEEYWCDEGDSGGVHINSGVPNHLFAMLVDGKTSNGVTVGPIGLDKAANLMWRVQTEYLTPSSDFVDFADALEAACTDLTGEDINELTLGSGPTGGGPEEADANAPITSTDCDRVTAAIEAVELRTEPVQCDFQPLLDPNAPNLCGANSTTQTVWSEDFEDGLDGWTQDIVMVNGAEDIPWEARDEAPEHDTKAAYAPDPIIGACDGSTEDITSVSSLISPVMAFPSGPQPKLSFEHYVATEHTWDGGLVSVSVNGGEFAPIDAGDYQFNAPGAPLDGNPLAGELAFTGTDGGEVLGSWGTSIVNLANVGAAPGDDLQFSFEFARDGCNGIDGWYIDNVDVTICKPKPKVKAQLTAQPVKKTVPSGSKPKVKVKVKAQGQKPTGFVTIKQKGKSKTLAKIKINGTKVITKKLNIKFKQGKKKFVAVYSGNARVKSATKIFKIKWKKKKR